MPVDLQALADALTDDTLQPFGKFGIRCKTCQLLHELPAIGEDARADLIRGYVNGKVEAAVVSDRLRAAGVHIGGDSIRRHRRGVCKTAQVVA